MQLLKFQILDHNLIWISDAFTVYNSSVSRDYFKVRMDSMFSAPDRLVGLKLDLPFHFV